MSETPGLITPLRICLLAGAMAIAVSAVAVNVWLSPVQAKVLLPRPAATLPPTAQTAQKIVVQQARALKPTPAQQRKSLLRGLASWYGGMFNGQKMANGDMYDQNAMTACHKTLPFGTWVKVVNLRNGRSVIVRITDRGALAAGRVMDLSYGAAQKLAMTNAGIAPVVLEVISRDKARQILQSQAASSGAGQSAGPSTGSNATQTAVNATPAAK
jgi:rare lipoprotein A